MNDVVKYLQECGTFYLATVEGDQPHVRPFGAVCEFEGKLYIVTNNKKTTSCTLFHAICRFLFKILVSTFLAQSIQQRVQIIKHYVLSYMPMQQ